MSNYVVLALLSTIKSVIIKRLMLLYIINITCFHIQACICSDAYRNIKK